MQEKTRKPKQDPSADTLKDPSEASKILGVSKRRLNDWVRAGQIPHVELPSGIIRFTPEQLEQFTSDRSRG